MPQERSTERRPRKCDCGLRKFDLFTRRYMMLTHSDNCSWHIDPQHLAEIEAREAAR